MSYNGMFGFHPLVVSLEQTREILSLVNRPGNVHSAEGVEVELERHIPRLKRHFQEVIVRGDSAFFSREVMATCQDMEAYFTISGKASKSMLGLAHGISERGWRELHNENRPSKKSKSSRRAGKNRRRATLRKRGTYDKRRRKEWIAETDYTPTGADEPLRLIVRRIEIEESRQQSLLTHYEYRFIITNLPCDRSPQRVVALHYRRCDQENVIQQISCGAFAMRFPTREFRSNSAFLQCARLAHNLKSWVSLLLLPDEVVRWEWKRFRHHFVYLAARVTRHARQVMVTFIGELRFGDWITNGVAALVT